MTYLQTMAKIQADTQRIREAEQRFREEMAVLDAKQIVRERLARDARV